MNITVRWQNYRNVGQIRVARARDQKGRGNKRVFWLWKENKRSPYGDVILCILTVVMGTQPWTHVIKLQKTQYTNELPRGQRIHLPMQEMWVWSLSQEDPLKNEMATHSSILAWEIPWTEPGRLQSMSCKELDMTERLSLHTNMHT